MLLNLYTSYLIIERVIVMKYFYANAKINHTLIENFTYEIGERGLVSRKKITFVRIPGLFYSSIGLKLYKGNSNIDIIRPLLVFYKGGRLKLFASVTFRQFSTIAGVSFPSCNNLPLSFSMPTKQINEFGNELMPQTSTCN